MVVLHGLEVEAVPHGEVGDNHINNINEYYVLETEIMIQH
jgi:hypothetical protein